MSPLLFKIFLICYLILFGTICFAWRAYIVWKKIGSDSLAIANPNEPAGYIEFLFKILILTTVVVILSYIFWPSLYIYYGLFFQNYISEMQIAGICLLIFSLIFCAISQASMGASWRIGIDKTHKTELITQGIFQYSRNPVYFSILITDLGMFLVLPNHVTLMILILGYVTLQIKVRLEEQYLKQLHGQVYLDYCAKVRRWF